jgi:hypothetical protein
MLIPFGVLSAAGVSGFDSDYELIASEILGSSQTSVTFSSLGTYSSTYKHLQIRYTGRSDGPNADDTLRVRFNSDTGSNYVFHQLGGSSTTVFSSALTSQTGTYPAQFAGSAAAANIFGSGVIDILDPYSASKNTTVRGLAGITGGVNLVLLRSGLWVNTASITTITIDADTGTNLVAGSRFSLYGIR